MKFRLFAASLLITAVPALADPAVGQWVTVDDDDGSHKSVVNISVNDEGKLRGTVIEILQEEEKGKLCEECPDDFKNQPIEAPSMKITAKCNVLKVFPFLVSVYHA